MQETARRLTYLPESEREQECRETEPEHGGQNVEGPVDCCGDSGFSSV